jgi:sucrose-6F-phosphate phosphohydrolase
MTKATLLITDVDDTLLGDDESLRRFVERTEVLRDFGFVLNSSRPITSVRRTLDALDVQLRPLATIGALGTEIAINESPPEDWAGRFRGWDRSVVDGVMLGLGAAAHDAEFQTPLKASFNVEPGLRETALASLAALDQKCVVIVSGETDFDVIPTGAGKGSAAMYCAHRFLAAGGKTIAAGDSGNDIELFDRLQLGIVVSNAREELRQAVDPGKTFFAPSPYAAGVLEGLRFWGLAIQTH